MDWKINNNATSDYLVVSTAGSFNSRDHQKMVADILSDVSWQPDTNVLFDHRELTFSNSDFADMFKASETHQANDERIGNGKAAMVVAGPSDYGVIRQFQLIVEDVVSAKFKIFEDIAPANAWLSSGSAD